MHSALQHGPPCLLSPRLVPCCAVSLPPLRSRVGGHCSCGDAWFRSDAAPHRADAQALKTSGPAPYCGAACFPAPVVLKIRRQSFRSIQLKTVTIAGSGEPGDCPTRCMRDAPGNSTLWSMGFKH